ncbi:hypothetical protein CR513_30799, partial [Mucuna pruriens]
LDVYPIKGRLEINQRKKCLPATSQDLAHLWHCRYLSYGGPKTLQLKEIVRGLPKSIWRSQKLELVHSDICGPITPISNSYIRYLICFIDDFTRKAWVNFLAKKFDAFDSFKSFQNCVEKGTGVAIKCLRTNHGGEFTLREFNEYCKKNRIKKVINHTSTKRGCEKEE